MSDLVGRLRERCNRTEYWYGDDDEKLDAEAAAEIERLRDLLDAAAVELERRGDDIERLQEEVELWKDRHGACQRDFEATLKEEANK